MLGRAGGDSHTLRRSALVVGAVLLHRCDSPREYGIEGVDGVQHAHSQRMVDKCAAKEHEHFLEVAIFQVTPNPNKMDGRGGVGLGGDGDGNRVGWDGMGWDGVGWSGMGWERIG